MSLFDTTAPFDTLDITRVGEDSLLASFDPLPRLPVPSSTATGPLSPFSAALSNQYVARQPSTPSRAARSDLLVDLGCTPPVKRKLFEEEPSGRSPARSPAARTPQTAKKVATASPSRTGSSRPPLLSLRSAAQPSITTSPSRIKPRTPIKAAQPPTDVFAEAETTTLPSFQFDASLIADEGPSFLANGTLTDDFSKMFIGASKGKKKIDADETLATDWFKTDDETKAIMDESMALLSNMTITTDLAMPPRSRTLSAPTPAPLPASPSRSPRSPRVEAPLLSRSPQKESSLKTLGLKSPAGRRQVAGKAPIEIWDESRAPPARPVFAPPSIVSAAPSSRQMGGLATPRAAHRAAVATAPLPRMVKSPSGGSLKGGLAPSNSKLKSKSSTSVAVRTSAVPRPSAVAAPRPSIAYGGGRRLSGIPAPAASGLKPFNLSTSRGPTSVPMVREISRPVAPASSAARGRPLSLQGGVAAAGLKRSLNAPSKSEALAPPRLPRSQSDATSLSSLARPSSAMGVPRSAYGRPPVRRV